MKSWIALAGLSILAFSAFLDYTIVNTALPAIQRGLNAPVIELQWIITIFAMTQCCFMIAAGRSADIYGRRKILYLGALCFFIGALISGVSWSIGIMILGRAVQGIGGSILFTVSAALISDVMPDKYRNLGIGIYGAVTGLGLALGPFLGGIITFYLSWRWIFFIYLPVIVFGFLLCIASIGKIKRPDTIVKVDLKGVVFLILSIGGLTFGLINAESLGWDRIFPWVFIVVGAISVGILLKVEKIVPHPMLELSIFKNKHLVMAILNVMTASIATFIILFFDPLFLSHVKHFTADKIGYVILIMPVAQVIISLFISKIVKLMGIFNLCMVSILIATLGTIMHLWISLPTPVWYILLSLFLLGISWGIGNAGTIIAASSYAESSKAGAIIGTIFSVWNIFGVVLLAISSVIYHRLVDYHHLNDFYKGYHAVIWFGVALSVIFSFFAVWLKIQDRQAREV